MKKFLACLFILGLFTGIVFYFGWTQFRVKPDTVGIDDKPVQNGEFAWHWQFLLPTNAQLKLFHIKPHDVQKTITGSLPSGQAYAAIYGAQGLFDYSFTFEISLTLSPQSLVELLKLNKISDDSDLIEYMDAAAGSLAQHAANFILTKADNNPDFKPESLKREEILRGIQIYKDFPELDVSVFSIQTSRLPDYKMYKKIQNMQPEELRQGVTESQSLTSVQEEI